MKDKRKTEPSSALLSKKGCLRLSSDLTPEDARKKKLRFGIKPLPDKRVLVIKILKPGEKTDWAVRRAIWANKASKCPMVSVCGAMSFLGVSLSEKSVAYKVKRRNNGELTIKF